MPEASLSCYIRQDDRCPVLVLEGCLDLANAPQAERALQSFLDAHGPYVVIDASRLDFIDSKGVGVMLSAAKAARDADGQLFLQEPALPVVKILEMCGLSSLFPPRPTPKPRVETAPTEAAPAANGKASRARAEGTAPARPARRAA
jgi:anti-sigma B factor antagonist